MLVVPLTLSSTAQACLRYTIGHPVRFGGYEMFRTADFDTRAGATFDILQSYCRISDMAQMSRYAWPTPHIQAKQDDEVMLESRHMGHMARTYRTPVRTAWYLVVKSFYHGMKSATTHICDKHDSEYRKVCILLYIYVGL